MPTPLLRSIKMDVTVNLQRHRRRVYLGAILMVVGLAGACLATLWH